MSNVLSDLFIMGSGSPSNASTSQKSSRKQANPRIHNAGKGNREVSPSSVNNWVVDEGKKRKLKGWKDADLSGFLRTEVTVIDTNLSPEWKAARVLYRKGLVWKVRERKVVRLGRKKRRRAGLVEKPGNEKVKVRNVGDVEGAGPIEQFPSLDKGSAQSNKREDSKEVNHYFLKPKNIEHAQSKLSVDGQNLVCQKSDTKDENENGACSHGPPSPPPTKTDPDTARRASSCVWKSLLYSYCWKNSSLKPISDATSEGVLSSTIRLCPR